MFDKKKLVIKIGTSSLTHSNGCLNIEKIDLLAKIISDIKKKGYDVILVTSAAISVGVYKLGLENRPDDIITKQAAAAVGQCELMNIYDKFFCDYDCVTAQVLITKDNIDNVKRKMNIVNTINRLIELSVLPIINENDTVSTDEIEFGDNDTLSSHVAAIMGFDLIIISDIDGLYNKDPFKYDDAILIDEVIDINNNIISFANESYSNCGTGGMITKIKASQIAKENKFNMSIINGNNLNNIYKLLNNEKVGTKFIFRR